MSYLGNVAGPVKSVAGKVGDVELNNADVGLSNVTNDAQLKIASNLSDLNNAAAARTNLGLGTAATAAVTTSATDATEGRLLKVGDFGLGVGLDYAGNLDALSANGFYKLTDTATNGPSGVDPHGSMLIHQEWDANAAFQIFCRYSTGQMYRRQKYGTWQSWREIYNQQSVLGTVGQVAGVPTGAIIERGSNANGEYVRFADGTQICVTQTDITTTSAFTNVFGTTSGTSYRNSFQWTYPAAFSAQPTVSAGTANVASPVEFSAVLPTSTFVLPYSSVNGAVISTFCFAIGRWF